MVEQELISKLEGASNASICGASILPNRSPALLSIHESGLARLLFSADYSSFNGVMINEDEESFGIYGVPVRSNPVSMPPTSAMDVDNFHLSNLSSSNAGEGGGGGGIPTIGIDSSASSASSSPDDSDLLASTSSSMTGESIGVEGGVGGGGQMFDVSIPPQSAATTSPGVEEEERSLEITVVDCSTGTQFLLKDVRMTILKPPPDILATTTSYSSSATALSSSCPSTSQGYNNNTTALNDHNTASGVGGALIRLNSDNIFFDTDETLIGARAHLEIRTFLNPSLVNQSTPAGNHQQQCVHLGSMNINFQTALTPPPTPSSIIDGTGGSDPSIEDMEQDFFK